MDLKRNGWYSQTGLRIPSIISKLKNNTKHVLNACGIMLCITLCFLEENHCVNMWSILKQMFTVYLIHSFHNGLKNKYELYIP